MQQPYFVVAVRGSHSLQVPCVHIIILLEVVVGGAAAVATCMWNLGHDNCLRTAGWLAAQLDDGWMEERVSEPHHESSPTELVVSELLKTDLHTGGAANTINRTAEQRNSYSRVESSQAKSAVNLHAREIHTHYRYTRDATAMALRCLVMLHKVAINRVGFSERGEYSWSGCLPAAAAERNIYKYYRGARMDGATKLLKKTTIGGGCWES